MGQHDEPALSTRGNDSQHGGASKDIKSVQPEGATKCSDNSPDCAIKELTCSLTGMAPLFTPLTIGSLSLTHRIVLAPLTRLRGSPEGVPNTELAGTYYAQRTTKGGLLISEATNISPQAVGHFRAPGIWSPEQTKAWKGITDAVHKKGGFIFLQLWHTGRASHSAFQVGHKLPVGPSPIAIKGDTSLPDGSQAPYEVPHELTEAEIKAIIEDYKKATKNSAAAGFDGVEIHGANGYLIDQFLHNGSNQRKDKYGGSIENRCRFLLEVVAVVKDAWKEAVGASSPLVNNVGIRLAPFGKYLEMSDSEEEQLYNYLVPKISEQKLCYVHMVEPRVTGGTVKNEALEEHVVYSLGKLFKGPVITAGGYRPDNANCAVYKGYHSENQQNVAVAFGRLFISNPDLPLRIFLRAPIQHYDRNTFYTHDPVGYTDQTFLADDVIKSHIEALRLSAPENEKLQNAIDGEVKLLKAQA